MTASVADTVSSQPAPPPRRRWRRCLLMMAALAALLVLFHAPLLRLLAYGLIVNDPVEPVDAIVFRGANEPFEQVPLDEAAALYRDGTVKRVVLIEDRSARVVRLGIVSKLESVVRPELAARGVPEEALTALVVTGPGDWEQARGLRDWLSENPEVRVIVVCEQLASRRVASAYRQVLGPDSARVRWRAVPDGRFSDTNWWRGHQGIVKLCSEYIALAYVVVNGEPEEPPQWDPDQYEQTLRNPPGQ